MRRLPPLSELRAFEAAARCLSFKHAAAELGVTPTAISHQIKLLEQHCGQPLFRRRPRPLALTSAGAQLFPVLRQGLDAFAEAFSKVRVDGANKPLRISATNAFSARWLVPRLPEWRAAHPRLKLAIDGTDAVLDLNAGEVDLAIRYAERPPKDGVYVELMRDVFRVVASPRLVGRTPRMMTPVELAKLPLIEAEWPPGDVHAPDWRRWQTAARARYSHVPDLAALSSLNFREELHAIEAAVAGHGVAICSSVLVGPELASGILLPLSKIQLSGYGFYAVHRPNHPKAAAIQAFIAWVKSAGLET